MCRALLGGGVETLIATTDADGDGRLGVELGRPVLYEGMPTIFFPRQWSEAYKYSHPLSRWVDTHVEDFDAVHIHAVFSHACLTTAKACRRHKVPYVVRPLGTLDPWSMRQKRFRKMLFWHLGVRRMLDDAAAIHYTAMPEQKLAEESLALKHGVVIPLGVQMDSFDKTENTECLSVGDMPLCRNPYVLMLSRLHRKKGVELLLPAFLSLVGRPEFADWKLVLAGDGEPEYVSSLHRLVHSHGGEGSVVFAGWVEGPRKTAMLQRAALLALPSYQENFGLCVVEALACGVPVLISPHVNLASEIEAAGAGWVTPSDTEALERTLAETFGDPQARTRRGAIGRELVSRRFTWDAVSQQLSALYNSIT
jgi:glycosyltransferase involved in cell wall biosynthesis